MAKRPDLTDLTSLTNSSGVNAINSNWDAIQEAFDNTLSLDGSTPNAMNADLDLNGNALLNVGTIDADNLTLDGQLITDVSAVPEWRGAWLTATSYAKRDMVKQAGNVYICLVAHTSGTFSTDLTDLKWELMVPKGDSGSGTGDLVSTNNLSDLADAATARSNLGLGTAAVESIVPVSKGGTGATDAAGARTALGLGPLATASTIGIANIDGAALVTSIDTILSNDNDVTIPTSAAVIDYTKTEYNKFAQLTAAGPVTTVNFTNLAGWDEIAIFIIATKANTGNPALRVSFNNGTTWQTTGYYGGTSDFGSDNLGVTNSHLLSRQTGSYTGFWRLTLSDMTTKGFLTGHALLNDGSALETIHGLSTTGVVNAIQLFSSGGSLTNVRIKVTGIRSA